jgi:hypothetical protein
LNTGCAPTLYWVHESSSLTSCQPDRLLQWTDFKLRVPEDKRGAETAIRFFLHPSERRLGIAFDHEHSWVKPELVAPIDPIVKRISEELLAHEQVHFLISCLMVRKANLSLTEHDDLLEILHLTNLEAQRLNLQYDAATNHGLNGDVQQIWEAEVMRQLKKFRK